MLDACDPDGSTFFRRFYGKSYYLHHLIWAWHHGIWPKRIDHENCDRKTTDRGNCVRPRSPRYCNSRQESEPARGRFSSACASTFNARITVNYKQIISGITTDDEAHAAYLEAARLHFGDFSRVRIMRAHQLSGLRSLQTIKSCGALLHGYGRRAVSDLPEKVDWFMNLRAASGIDPGVGQRRSRRESA